MCIICALNNKTNRENYNPNIQLKKIPSIMEVEPLTITKTLYFEIKKAIIFCY
jgi:hypothetical protein